MTAADVVTTAGVLGWLRRRRGDRRRKLGRAAYALYLATLLVVLYGIPAFSSLGLTLGRVEARADVGPIVGRSLLPALASLFVVALAVIVRSARWRGPVVLAVAEVAWLLALPLDRRRVLLPRFFVSLAVAGATGAVTGALVAVMVHAVRPSTTALGFAMFVAAFALVAMLGVSLALVIEASPRAEAIAQQWSPVLFAVGAVFAVVAVDSASSGSRVGWSDDLVAWSGPWGWAAYSVAAVHRGASLGTGASVSIGALFVVSLGAVAVAARVCGAVPTRSLRVRARVAQSVGAAVFMGDARQARLSIRAGRARAGRARGRVRLPRSPRLVIVWRDLTGIVRGPGQLGCALAFAVGAVAVLAIGTAASSAAEPPVLIVAVAVLGGYAAAASLLETARLDGDSPQVASQLPMRFSCIALQHAIVATGVLASIAMAAWLLGSALEPAFGLTGVLAVALCTPVLVAAALFNAYRGRVPFELLLVAGDAGGFLIACWYLAAPLVTVGVLTPVIVGAFHPSNRTAGAGSTLASFALTSVVATSIGLWAVAMRARRRVAPPREGGLFARAGQPSPR